MLWFSKEMQQTYEEYLHDVTILCGPIALWLTASRCAHGSARLHFSLSFSLFLLWSVLVFLMLCLYTTDSHWAFCRNGLNAFAHNTSELNLKINDVRKIAIKDDLMRRASKVMCWPYRPVAVFIWDVSYEQQMSTFNHVRMAIGGKHFALLSEINITAYWTYPTIIFILQ